MAAARFLALSGALRDHAAVMDLNLRWVAPALLASLHCGCQTASGEPSRKPAPTAAPQATDGPASTGPSLSDEPSKATAASATPSPSGDAAPNPAPGQPVCAGKAPGESACDGNKLVACLEGGASKEVQSCYSIERCDAAQKACVPACPQGEVYIPATGAEGFKMGRGYLAREGHAKFGKGHLPDSDRPHNVVLTKPFCMDEHEVTVRQLIPWVEAGKSDPPRIGRNFVTYPKKLDHPVNSYSWPQAKAFCEGEDKSLPTEAQWEWAAGGRDGHTYPWGDEAPDCERSDYTPGILPRPSADAGCHGGGPSAVGSHPSGDRVWPTGHLHDMAGNVWEWTASPYCPYPEHECASPHRVFRGGGWGAALITNLRTSVRMWSNPAHRYNDVGFRCVKSR